MFTKEAIFRPIKNGEQKKTSNNILCSSPLSAIIIIECILHILHPVWKTTSTIWAISTTLNRRVNMCRVRMHTEKNNVKSHSISKGFHLFTVRLFPWFLATATHHPNAMEKLFGMSETEQKCVSTWTWACFGFNQIQIDSTWIEKEMILS